jgi:preprotein translocase subunit YajC
VSPAPLVVLLQAGGNGAGSLLQSPIVPFGIMLLLIWLLIIRPQQRKQRDHDAMLKAIEKGDQVVTSGGLHGKVVGVTDETLTLEIAALKGERVRVKVARSKVEGRQAAGKGEES